jgi:hypothetical protein
MSPVGGRIPPPEALAGQLMEVEAIPRSGGAAKKGTASVATLTMRKKAPRLPSQ